MKFAQYVFVFLFFLISISLGFSIATPVNCGDTLNVAGDYIVSDNLSCSNVNAITITSNNVDLDCQGHTISSLTSSNRGLNVIGSLGNELSLNVSNCNFVDFDIGGYFIYVNNSIINNVNFSSNDQYGIYTRYSDYNTFKNLETITNTLYGIYFHISNFN